jgi:hypothetical protein
MCSSSVVIRGPRRKTNDELQEELTLILNKCAVDGRIRLRLVYFCQLIILPSLFVIANYVNFLFF